MRNSTLIALSAGLALGLFSAPAAADDLDDTLRIIGNVFPVHHTGRILVCYDDDDDDDGRGCHYVRRGHAGEIYHYNDDDDGHRWRGYDDDDDDGGRWHDDDD